MYLYLDFDFLDEPKERIVLRPGDENYGPISFDASDYLYPAAVITGVSAKAYREKWTGMMEEFSGEKIVNDTLVSGETGKEWAAYFTYPGSEYQGDVYVMWQLNLAGDTTKTLGFGPINVVSI